MNMADFSRDWERINPTWAAKLSVRVVIKMYFRPNLSESYGMITKEIRMPAKKAEPSRPSRSLDSQRRSNFSTQFSRYSWSLMFGRIIKGRRWFLPNGLRWQMSYLVQLCQNPLGVYFDSPFFGALFMYSLTDLTKFDWFATRLL